jgi:transcriptional regulator with XRE-family HTH domain
MDKETALTALLQRCFDARLAVYELCDMASVSRATVSRWKADPSMISPKTLAKLEDALGAYERERAV